MDAIDVKGYHDAFQTNWIKSEPREFDILTKCESHRKTSSTERDYVDVKIATDGYQEQNEEKLDDVKKLDPEDLCNSKISENLSTNEWSKPQIKIEENVDILYYDIKTESVEEKSSESVNRETNFIGCTSYGWECSSQDPNEDRNLDVKLSSCLATDSRLQPLGAQDGDVDAKARNSPEIFRKIPVPPMENDHKMKCKFSPKPVRVRERIHTVRKPLLCKICSKSFRHRSTLKVHARIHNGERPFHCKNCSKSFNQRSDMTRHERIHTGEKPFDCKNCLKSFNQIHTLKRHERIHTGDKPFHCKICSKSFSSGSYLKDHERIHTGEKPFDCRICSKSFLQECHLKLHEMIHSGKKKFQCKFCSKSFNRRDRLKNHERSHTGE